MMSNQIIELVDTGCKNFAVHAKIDHLKPESTSFQYLKSSPIFDDLKRNFRSVNRDSILDVEEDIILDGFEILDEFVDSRNPIFCPFGKLTSARFVFVLQITVYFSMQ